MSNFPCSILYLPYTNSHIGVNICPQQEDLRHWSNFEKKIYIHTYISDIYTYMSVHSYIQKTFYRVLLTSLSLGDSLSGSSTY